MNKILLSTLVAVGVAVTSGCSSTDHTPPPAPPAEVRIVSSAAPHDVEVAPGVVRQVWEEPMVDIVDVPPGLDPEGHYYRPAHQAAVEVRQGRWKYYEPK